MYKPNVFKKYVLFTEFLGQGHNRNSTTTHSGGTEFETPWHISVHPLAAELGKEKQLKAKQTHDATILYLFFIKFNYCTYIELEQWNIKTWTNYVVMSEMLSRIQQQYLTTVTSSMDKSTINPLQRLCGAQLNMYFTECAPYVALFSKIRECNSDWCIAVYCRHPEFYSEPQQKVHIHEKHTHSETSMSVIY